VSFTHIITFKWKYPDQSAKAAAAADALRAFVADLDGVESYICGSDIGLTPASCDFAVGPTQELSHALTPICTVRTGWSRAVTSQSRSDWTLAGVRRAPRRDRSDR
jgi:hypothetical protein